MLSHFDLCPSEASFLTLLSAVLNVATAVAELIIADTVILKE